VLKKIKHIIQQITYSFPFQLLLLQIKKHSIFNIVWLILFLIITQQFGKKFGVHLLLLDPYYLNSVSIYSFYFIGLAMGGFIMAWNVSLYILNSYRFEFLACISKPFVRFSFNNFLIPAVFSIVYIISIIKFQQTQNLESNKNIFLFVLALILGNLSMIVIYTLYFIFFTEDVKSFLSRITEKTREQLIKKDIDIDFISIDKEPEENRKWKVLNYWHYPWKISGVKDIPIYDKKLIDEVYYLHHRNSFVIIFVSISTLIALGYLMDYPIFRIPAGTTLFLLLTILIIFFTIFTFWFRGWRTIALFSFVFILNILTQYNLIVYNHKFYGLDYRKYKKYSVQNIEAQANRNQVKNDIRYTENILNNWKKKNNPLQKPKLLIINVGGGGAKAAYWTFKVTQELDNLTQHAFFKRTALISGASGGMLGIAYYRELYLQSQNNKDIKLKDKKYLDNIGKDMLNGVTTSIAMNDIFYPFRKFEYENIKYNKDRAYIFDKEFNENTNFILNKKLSEYKIPEKTAQIPMMIIGSTIINDQRMMYLSPQPISYLLKPYIQSNQSINEYIGTDAIEFNKYFKELGAKNVNFVSALRMNATYPYIFPAVSLPTKPQIKAMDAGFRDNFGYIVTARFMSSFKKWIEENTSGVIVVTIKVDDKSKDYSIYESKTYISELLAPIGGIYSNMLYLQYYNADQNFATLYNNYKTNINFIDFTYKPSNKNKAASLSLHLSNKEKQDIQESFYNESNQKMKRKLLNLMY
jgi:hypothetical protein